MIHMSIVKFTKMHGAGNDYIYINCLHQAPTDPSAMSKALSHRHYSIGSNGLVLILPSTVADFQMRMFNSDGSEGAMCGNAIRCVGKYVYDKGLTDETDLTIETASGNKSIKLNINNGKVQTVSVDMGVPVVENDTLSVTANGNHYTGRKVDMGNPHFVIFSHDVQHLPVCIDGPVIEEMQEHFPDRVNVEFAEVLSPTHIRMRVWERGSGETLACGTGACAVAVAAVYEGRARQDSDITVSLPGGDIVVRYGDNMWMTGAAVTVFEGEIETTF